MADKISQYAAEAKCDRFDGDMTGAQAHSIRERLGLTEMWLAQASGTSEDDVTRWEHSNHPVPYSVANALFDVFQRTRHAVAVVAAEQRATVPAGPVVTFRTDEAYRDATGGPYSAAWHRAAAGRIDDATGCGLIYE